MTTTSSLGTLDLSGPVAYRPRSPLQLCYPRRRRRAVLGLCTRSGMRSSRVPVQIDGCREEKNQRPGESRMGAARAVLPDGVAPIQSKPLPRPLIRSRGCDAGTSDGPVAQHRRSLFPLGNIAHVFSRDACQTRCISVLYARVSRGWSFLPSRTKSTQLQQTFQSSSRRLTSPLNHVRCPVTLLPARTSVAS